ncbi:MAG TPA: hypothetical protein ENJ37_00425 [Deltaproteobacteria bacterium]|nr:hypothetical protein [Deltaproteobacteria bacterium]
MSVKYSEVIDRMRLAGNIKRDSEAARTLGVTPQAFSNYKKRGEIPTDLVLKFAAIYGLSVDWLLTGEGEMHRSGNKLLEGETKHCTIAMVETTRYDDKNHESRPRITDLSPLTPDEMVYVGKLLKILRGTNQFSIPAVKYNIDAILKTYESQGDTAV